MGTSTPANLSLVLLSQQLDEQIKETAKELSLKKRKDVVVRYFGEEKQDWLYYLGKCDVYPPV